MDLKDAYHDWDRQEPAPAWAEMMTHFSIEIQRNQTDLSKIKRQGEAHAILEQVKEQKEERTLQLMVV